jgi:hypothetical protein
MLVLVVVVALAVQLHQAGAVVPVHIIPHVVELVVVAVLAYLVKEPMVLTHLHQ